MFGKKKKESVVQVSTAAPVIAEAEAKAQQVQETKETNRQLSDARVTKNEIDGMLRFLRTDPEFNNKMLKKAQSNEKKIDELEMAKKAAEEKAKEEGKEPPENKLYDLESKMYVLPEKLDTYGKAIDAVEMMFQSKSAVDSVEMGADKLNALLKDYLLQLREALEDGRAMTADACLNILRYVIEVGYRFEGTSDPRRLQERMDEKIKFVRDTGTQLIRTITEYYNQLADYEITEGSYNETYTAYMEKVKEVKDMPDYISQKIDRLGFKRAMKELPPGDEARKYLKIILDTQGELSVVYLRSMELESMSMGLSNLKQGINEYLTECKRAFERKGDVFDYEAHQKRIFELRKKSIDNINRINDMTVENHKLNEKTMSLLKEAAENEALGDSVSSAMESIKYYEKLKKNNEFLRQQIAVKESERKAAEEKEKNTQTNYAEQENEQEQMEVDME